MNIKIRIIKKVLITTAMIAQAICIADARSHNAISPLTYGASNAVKRFLPKLNRNKACYPYTAVDTNGNYNNGLVPSLLSSASG